MEASKTQAATPNFVLSLLAACSTSVPAAGREGEVTLSNQISSLLQDKAMAIDELNLVYSYSFGFSIKDALQFTGFHGTILEFLDQQKCFAMQDGCISAIKVSPPLDEQGAEARHGSDISKSCDKDADDETASVAETESTAHAESLLDTDSDVDVTGWHTVGNRLVTALGSPTIGEADADKSGAVPWKTLSGRVAAALRAEDYDDDNDDDEAEADINAWRDVGSRLLAGFKRTDGDECCEDPIPDAAEWQSVGARVLRSLENLDGEADGF